MFVLNNMVRDARVTREASSLARAGHKVTVYALWDGDTTSREEKNGFAIRRMPVRLRWLPKNAVCWAIKYLEWILRCAWAAVADGCQVAHGHDMSGLVPAWLVSRLTRARLVYDAHELFSEQALLSAPRLWRRLERWLIPRVDLCLSAEENRSRILFEEYGAPHLPVTIVNCPQYMDVRRTYANRDGQGPRREWARTVIYQGGLNWERCILELIQSVALFPPETGLLLIGPATEEFSRRMSQTVEGLGIEGRVKILAAVPFEVLPSITVNADVGVLFYRNTDRNNYYCAPNKLYEYMMAGLAVVGPDFPGVRRILQGVGAGLVCNPEDPADIGRVVNALLGDPAYLAECQQRGLAAARETYNWECEEAKLLEAYDKLAAGGGPRPQAGQP